MCACACEHLCRISVTDMPLDCDPSYVWLMDQRCKGIFHSPMYQEKPSAPGLTALPPTRCGYLPAEQRGIVVNLKGDLKAEYGPVSPQPFLRGDGFEECVLRSVS